MIAPVPGDEQLPNALGSYYLCTYTTGRSSPALVTSPTITIRSAGYLEVGKTGTLNAISPNQTNFLALSIDLLAVIVS